MAKAPLPIYRDAETHKAVPAMPERQIQILNPNYSPGRPGNPGTVYTNTKYLWATNHNYHKQVTKREDIIYENEAIDYRNKTAKLNYLQQLGGGRLRGGLAAIMARGMGLGGSSGGEKTANLLTAAGRRSQLG